MYDTVETVLTLSGRLKWRSVITDFKQEATQDFSEQGLAGFIKKSCEMKTLLAELRRVAAM